MIDHPKDPFGGLAEFQRRLESALRPFGEVTARLSSVLTDPATVATWGQITRDFTKTGEALVKTIAPIAARFSEFGKQLVALGKLSHALDAAGWLPHVTTPVHLLEGGVNDPALLSDLIERFYSDNWTAIRAELETRLDSYLIDEEAKAAFREALSAHEAGLYRAVCRHLFPEVERVSRIEIHEGSFERITSQNKLQELAGGFTPGQIEPGGLFALQLFRRLSQHLYADVRDEQVRQQMEKDAVPNRHAAVHGLVVYKSPKNSLNTIFMTDYLFQIVHLIKSESRQQNSRTVS